MPRTRRQFLASVSAGVAGFVGLLEAAEAQACLFHRRRRVHYPPVATTPVQYPQTASTHVYSYPAASTTVQSPSSNSMAASAKTFRIDRRKRIRNGESREGYITVTSSGHYEGRVNFRCNCDSFFCACNFDSARIELRDVSNTTVTTVPFNPDRFDLAKASDTDVTCSGWNRLIAEAFDRIVFADPMFRSN